MIQPSSSSSSSTTHSIQSMSRLAHLTTRRNQKDKSKSSFINHHHSSGSSVQVSSNWAHTLAEPLPESIPPKRSSIHHHHHQSHPYHPNSLNRNSNSERQQTIYVAAGFDPFNPKLSQTVSSLPTHSTTLQAHPSSLCDSPASFEQTPTVQKTRTALLDILQDSSQLPHEKSIFQRRPSLSNTSTKSGPTSSRNSSASLRRQSNSTPIIGLNLGLDPLNSFVSHPPRASTSILSSDSSVASSPLLTAHISPFHQSHLFKNPTLNLNDHECASQTNRPSGLPFTQSDQSNHPFTRRASSVNTFNQPQEDVYDDLSRSRRPSAPNLTSPLPNELSFKLNSNHSTHSRSFTEFGASLETYRFGGTAQLSGDLQSGNLNDSSYRSHRPTRRLDYDDQRYESPPPHPYRTRRQSTLKNDHLSEINDLFVPFDKSAIISNSIPYTPPSQSGSTGSDREKDAPHFVRALSTDMSLYAPSVSSLDSHSTSHHRCRTGSYSSGGTRCPLLDPNCPDSRRASDAGSILPMRPLPTMMQADLSQPSSQTHNMYNYYNPKPKGFHPPPTPSGLNRPIPSSSMVPSSSMLSSNSSNSSSNGGLLTSGGNVFLPLRRRFLPNRLDQLNSNLKPRVETQLLGELLLALEEYVGAFGRTVKVSGSHRLGVSSSSAAATVVVAVTSATGASNESNGTNLLDFVLDLDRLPSPLIGLEHESILRPHHFLPSSSSSSASSCIDEEEQPTMTSSKSELKISRHQLAEVCEELEYVTSEVVDVVPAFGEKLMQGHYGPLAVRYPSSSSNSPPITSNSTNPNFSRNRTAIERFMEYEPGGIKDGSDGGNGWWAERLLRDLLEGLVSTESVVSNNPTNLLISSSNHHQSVYQYRDHHLHNNHKKKNPKDLSGVEEVDEGDEVDESFEMNHHHHGFIGTNGLLGLPDDNNNSEIDLGHRELLLDEGRKRWLAYQAHKGKK